jgi:hypothetical protein
MPEQQNINNDFQELINHSHATAERLLLEQEEFYPFGAYLDNEGKLKPVGFYDGDEFPLGETIIKGLDEHFQKQLKAEEIRAYAITLDTRVRNDKFPEAVDAVSIRITHKDTDNIVTYYFPYKLGQKQIEFLESLGEYGRHSPAYNNSFMQ